MWSRNSGIVAAGIAQGKILRCQLIGHVHNSIPHAGLAQGSRHALKQYMHAAAACTMLQAASGTAVVTVVLHASSAAAPGRVHKEHQQHQGRQCMLA
jgi:hypothetical protein